MPRTGSAAAAAGKTVTAPTKGQRLMSWATYGGTTDASGYLTLPHSAGFTPSCIFVTLLTAGMPNVLAGVDSITATTFRIRLSGVSAATAVTLAFACLTS